MIQSSHEQIPRTTLQLTRGTKMTRDYASAVFCSTKIDIKASHLGHLIGARRSPAWACHMERAYDCAFRFCFNEFYARAIQVEHLLSFEFDPAGILGKVWSDWILLTDRQLNIKSLHLNFCFPAQDLQLRDPACRTTGALARFLQKIYMLSETASTLPGGLAELSRVLYATRLRRSATLGISRYLYTSVTSCTRSDTLTWPASCAGTRAVALAMRPSAVAAGSSMRSAAGPGHRCA